MNDSATSLEHFIDQQYNNCINMALNTPSCAPSTLEGFGDLPTDPLEQKVHASVMSTMASWMGELNHNMQETFNSQFEQALSNMKIDLLEHISSMDIIDSLNNTTRCIEELEQEITELKDNTRVLEGRLTRTEKEVEELKEQLLNQEARSMRDNLKFFNIPEQQGENCERTLYDFFHFEMKISDDDMKRIRFDRVHRVGPYIRGQNRVIVAKFNPSEGRHIVMAHIKYLDKQKKFGVNEQLPRELAERKKQLIPKYKQAKTDNKNPKWTLDKLIIDGKVQETKKDKVMDINVNTTEKAVSLQPKIHHSPPTTHNGSTFQGHSLKITSQDDIIPALHAIYSDARVARATHNIYAYRLKSGNGYLEHFSDDGEWGAGTRLLNMLREKDISDKLVCVTRWYGGTHLGKARFDYILNAARNTLNNT